MDYQFHFLDARGETPFMDLCEAGDDGEALLMAARGMQEHASCVAVRVFQGMRLVCQLARPMAGAWDRPAIHGAGSWIEEDRCGGASSGTGTQSPPN